jgi:Protein of unknown function (DUF1214)
MTLRAFKSRTLSIAFRFNSWMPFKYKADGSLGLYFKNENPGKDKEINWLPSPKRAFNLTLRLCAPKSDALIFAEQRDHVLINLVVVDAGVDA